MTRKIFLTTILLLLGIPSLGYAAFTYNSAEFQNLISKFDMQGHADHDLSNCTVKKVYYEEVIESLNTGKAPQEIIQSYVNEYGQAALRTPASDKTGILAWAMPAVGLLAGAMIVFQWINKRKASGKALGHQPNLMGNWQSDIDKEIFEKTLDEERRKLF